MKLHLGKVHVVGHSYGALTALFLAVKHPDLIRTLVLAEAPAIPLLAHLSGDRAQIGKTTFADIQDRMVKPMKEAFQEDDREAGLRAFIDYVLDDSHAWDKMPEPARQDMLNHAHEWDVMMTTGELFPDIQPQAIREITVPVLLLSGEKSYSFLRLIDGELEHLLPHNRRIVLRGATHNMWFEQPEVCRKAVLDFWREQDGAMQPKERDKASEAILGLRPVTFHCKSDAKGTPQFGLIAEEVAQVDPNLVVRDNNGNGNGNSNADGHSDSYINSNSNCNSYGYTYSHGYGYGDAASNADSRADACCAEGTKGN